MIRIVPIARALALASLAALLATAVAQGVNHGHAHGDGNPPPGATAAPTGMGMGMGSSMPRAAQAVDEAGFLVHMILHHREAVASAQALGAVTERPELLELVDAIVATQSAEIEAMEGWLDAWYPTVARDIAYASMMRDLGADAAAADVERAFLEDMIGHHMMAVHEAQTLLMSGLAEHDEVAALARSIVAGQMGEMHQMATWLSAWFGVDAPLGMAMGAAGMGGMPGMGMAGTGMPGTGTGMPGMGMPGTGTPGTSTRGMGMPEAGAGRMGMGMGAAGGMSGMDGMGGGMHESMHGTMHGPAAGGMATIRPDEVERLVRAFLAGQGVDASTAVLEATTLVYEVTVRVDGATRVLRVDATTGAVGVAPAR